MNPDAEVVAESILMKIYRHWRGEGTLAWAYWGFGFGGGFLVLAVLALSFLFIMPFAYSPDRGIQGSRIFLIYLLCAGCLYAAYVVATLVMVFRCGDNVGWPGWKYIARFMVVLWLGNILITIAAYAL